MTTDRLPPADPYGSLSPTQLADPARTAGGAPRPADRWGNGHAEPTVPRALAWSWLLAGDSSLQAHGPLPWPVPAVAADNEGQRPRVVVAWRRWRQPPRLCALSGAVMIDFPRPPIAALQDAGLSHIRRFAVLPRLDGPRWFIPLDSPGVAAAGFQLTQPMRPWLRSVHRAARMVVASGLPLWYRHQLCIATRHVAPLESHLLRVLNLDWSRFAFTAGNADVVRNRKRTLVALDRRGCIRGYAKIPSTPLGADRLRREAEVLRQLHRSHPTVAAPQVVSDQQVDGHGVLVTSALDGPPPAAALTAAHQQFLRSLQRGGPQPAANLPWLRRLAERLDAPTAGRFGADALRSVWPTLQSMTVPVTFHHGDFAPWNLRERGNSLAAFDWEYGEPDGLPLLDACHHLTSVEYFLGAKSLVRLERQLSAMAHSNSLGLTARQVRALQVVYLLDHLCRLAEEGYPQDYPKRLWWQQVLDQVLAAMRCGEEA